MVAHALLAENPHPTSDEVRRRFPAICADVPATSRLSRLSAARTKECCHERGWRKHPRLDAARKCRAGRNISPTCIVPACFMALFWESRTLTHELSPTTCALRRKLPGVVSVLTGADLKGGNLVPLSRMKLFVAGGKVRYVGEPVCIVAAEDERTARRAAPHDRGGVRGASCGPDAG